MRFGSSIFKKFLPKSSPADEDEATKKIIEWDEAEKKKKAAKNEMVLSRINDRIKERIMGKGLSDDKRFIWLPEKGQVCPHRPQYSYMDLFEEKVGKCSLVTIGQLREMSTRFKVSEAIFSVSVVRRGMLHVELAEDDTEDSWTVIDILSLPESIYIS
ncbi:hypothetical protein Hypma_003677 [Hypsizygus marmoreus]|uniref:Uncharacterized protein n=1 Tax=Hypsizygus marmoreus TaxID=39966 RepID=A0A369J643_HYPMA|nr:hypothetical protein Hypma_003677 [Hypsizygus marmoreus]